MAQYQARYVKLLGIVIVKMYTKTNTPKRIVKFINTEHTIFTTIGPSKLTTSPIVYQGSVPNLKTFVQNFANKHPEFFL